MGGFLACGHLPRPARLPPAAASRSIAAFQCSCSATLLHSSRYACRVVELRDEPRRPRTVIARQNGRPCAECSVTSLPNSSRHGQDGSIGSSSGRRGCPNARKQPRIDPCNTTHRRCHRRRTFAPGSNGLRPGRATPIQPAFSTRVTASSCVNGTHGPWVYFQ
jgi:hypothetical protein